MKRCQEYADHALDFKADIGIEYGNKGMLICCADASFGNIDDKDYGEKTRSQGGYVLGVGGAGDNMRFLKCVSMSIRRVCRSTLAAEANAVIEATESCDYLKSVVTVLLNPDMSLPDVANQKEGIKTTWYTDVKSLYDLITKDTSRPAEKRLRIVLAQLREMATETKVAVQWIDTQLMLADALTKVEAEKLYLLTAVKDNFWNNTPTTETLAAKPRKRAGRKARHNKKKEKFNQNDEDDGKAEVNIEQEQDDEDYKYNARPTNSWQR